MTKPTKKAAKRSERPKTTTQTTMPALIPRPDGRGALRAGGTPGNKGGGRTAEVIREAMRGKLDADVLPRLAEQFVAKEISALGYAEFLAKYGLGTKEELTVVSPDVRSRLARQVQVITEALDPATAESLLAKLDEVWA